MKRILKCFCIVLTFLLCFVNVKANDFSVGLESINTKANEEFKINVYLENNPGLISMLFDIEYDDTIFTLTDVQDSGNFGTNIHSKTYKSPYSLCWANDTANKNIEYSGVIATLTFQVNENVEEGDYFIHIIYEKDNYSFIDVDLGQHNPTIINSKIHIESNDNSSNEQENQTDDNTQNNDDSQNQENETIQDDDKSDQQDKNDEQFNQKDETQENDTIQNNDKLDQEDENQNEQNQQILNDETFIKVEQKEPTCETEGNIEYYFDEEENKYYLDESKTQETTIEDIKTEKTEHDYVYKKDKNFEWKECSICKDIIDKKELDNKDSFPLYIPIGFIIIVVIVIIVIKTKKDY